MLDRSLGQAAVRSELATADDEMLWGLASAFARTTMATLADTALTGQIAAFLQMNDVETRRKFTAYIGNAGFGLEPLADKLATLILQVGRDSATLNPNHATEGMLESFGGAIPQGGVYRTLVSPHTGAIAKYVFVVFCRTDMVAYEAAQALANRFCTLWHLRDQAQSQA